MSQKLRKLRKSRAYVMWQSYVGSARKKVTDKKTRHCLMCGCWFRFLCNCNRPTSVLWTSAVRHGWLQLFECSIQGPTQNLRLRRKAPGLICCRRKSNICICYNQNCDWPNFVYNKCIRPGGNAKNLFVVRQLYSFFLRKTASATLCCGVMLLVSMWFRHQECTRFLYDRARFTTQYQLIWRKEVLI